MIKGFVSRSSQRFKKKHLVRNMYLVLYAVYFPSKINKHRIHRDFNIQFTPPPKKKLRSLFLNTT